MRDFDNLAEQVYIVNSLINSSRVLYLLIYHQPVL
jgi:hypothetical protein